jgi:helicase required for RNAi-mediated heterochromatin assembly 1
MPCGETLPCGHKCPLRCHPYDSGHARVRCQESVPSFCQQGHLTIRKCSDPADKPCSTCTKLAEIRDKARQARMEQVRWL